MSTRRSFLKLSSLSVGAATLGLSKPLPARADNSDLPGPIVALESLADQARPVTAEERGARIEKARALMLEQGLEGILLTGGTSLNYFTGVSWSLSERLFALLLPARGRAFVVCPAFEAERAREQLAKGPLAESSDVLTWEEHEDPYKKVATGLSSLNIQSGVLGIEETVQYQFSEGMAKSVPGLDYQRATSVTAGCRMTKDAHELELMQLASTVTLKAYEATYRSLEAGMSQAKIRELISAAHDRLGFSGGAMVLIGSGSALPHGSIKPETLREGTIVLIDGGCGVEGYRSDISRTFVLGKPTQKMTDVFAIEVEAQDAALAAAGPGIPCEAVDAAARKVIVDAGFGPDYKYFSHRVGHGIGMDGHEWPYLVRGNRLPMEPGMTFSDEPGIYLPGEFGVRLEDDMIITDSGAKLFTLQSRSLERPFGD
jgi:Xaa-Pro dipeptidase